LRAANKIGAKAPVQEEKVLVQGCNRNLVGINGPACRLMQGIASGGEWGGAVLMAAEHSPIDKRGFYGSMVQIGFPLGMALGTASFFALAYLNDEQFTSWGWRIPYPRECGARCDWNIYQIANRRNTGFQARHA
jgi:MFS family permease